MSFEYLEIQDSDYLEHHVENEELDYILVKNRSIETVPIESWNPPAYCFTRR